jgi:hypothetical protein
VGGPLLRRLQRELRDVECDGNMVRGVCCCVLQSCMFTCCRCFWSSPWAVYGCVLRAQGVVDGVTRSGRSVFDHCVCWIQQRWVTPLVITQGTKTAAAAGL